MAVTLRQERKIQAMRKRQMGYRSIAAELGISRDTVRNYCVAHGLNGCAVSENSKAKTCAHCGGKIVQPKRGRPRRFCSNECCRAWWKEHPEAIDRCATAEYESTCLNCGQQFTAYGNNHRRYCSHACYIQHRFKSCASA